MNRCAWVPENVPEYVAYHDEEWGVPSHDDRHLFELLVLEGAQAGLSWLTILRKREGYRRAFAGFDLEAVAKFGDPDVERLLGDAGIVRHRGKIEAAIANARAALELESLCLETIFRRLPRATQQRKLFVNGRLELLKRATRTRRRFDAEHRSEHQRILIRAHVLRDLLLVDELAIDPRALAVRQHLRDDV